MRRYSVFALAREALRHHERLGPRLGLARAAALPTTS